MELFIKAPTHVAGSIVSSKSKKVALTMNNYRNWHYRASNNLKKHYKLRIVRAQLPQEKFTLGQAKVTCTFFAKRKWCDLDNFTVVHTKFCLDALVECWYLIDDNTDYIVGINNVYWWIDRVDPRVEIRVEEVF